MKMTGICELFCIEDAKFMAVNRLDAFRLIISRLKNSYNCMEIKLL